MSKEWLSSAKAVGSTHRARLQACQPAWAVHGLSTSRMVTPTTWSLQSLAQQLHNVGLLSQAAILCPGPWFSLLGCGMTLGMSLSPALPGHAGDALWVPTMKSHDHLYQPMPDSSLSSVRAVKVGAVTLQGTPTPPMTQRNHHCMLTQFKGNTPFLHSIWLN
ncbi:hypothetical protein Celaphus_00002306 [Cervus elaphus hippelaphus]|uniref:Uncharacterized protein n=1 Tax=Cervus elaphus hippelaphus TaxID=46360 RepID=A0A212CFM5_CEREH|nr:hypothetical protein Celaphus_00002306 [Cervus elaphus hippelaphus]